MIFICCRIGERTRLWMDSLTDSYHNYYVNETKLERSKIWKCLDYSEDDNLLKSKQESWKSLSTNFSDEKLVLPDPSNLLENPFILFYAFVFTWVNKGSKKEQKATGRMLGYLASLHFWSIFKVVLNTGDYGTRMPYRSVLSRYKNDHYPDIGWG